jgi:hypothetical protein
MHSDPRDQEKKLICTHRDASKIEKNKIANQQSNL